MITRHVSFLNRADAGERLAEKLSAYAGRSDVVVLALPRGGVPVAYEVAVRLRAPLDVLVVRKLGVPGFEELAMGAIASGGARVVNERVLRELGEHASSALERVTGEQMEELERRAREYRDGHAPLDLRGRVAILVDDGLATGASMRAAVAALREAEVARVVVAVPVGAAQTCRELEAEVDETICALAPEWFEAVGHYYADFSQTSDDEVRELLSRARQALVR